MAYADVSDMRAEGVTDPPYSDPRVQLSLDLATLMIDRFTGWFFEPRDLELLVDGRGHDTLYLAIPIIEITKLETGDGADWTEVDLTGLEIYNRHLTGQLHPIDDRYNPKIVRAKVEPWRQRLERLEELWFYKGEQNVRVTGKFGYTDPDGSATGKTPDLIKWCCLRLAIKELPPMMDEEWDETHARHRIQMEKTRDQSITLRESATTKKGGGGALGSGRVLTGDPTIDAVLSHYRKQIDVRGI